jgi:hypothetical protein
MLLSDTIDTPLLSPLLHTSQASEAKCSAEIQFSESDLNEPTVLYHDSSRGNYEASTLRCPMFGIPHYGFDGLGFKPWWDKIFSLLHTHPHRPWDQKGLLYN